MKKRNYAHLMDPKENPDYVRRSVKPPDWEVFGKRVNFVALRSFSVREGKICGYKEILDSYTVHNTLANVIWPSILFYLQIIWESWSRKLKSAIFFFLISGGMFRVREQEAIGHSFIQRKETLRFWKTD